ncbi:hypothetical protein QUC31_019162 [Theobroma cacao]
MDIDETEIIEDQFSQKQHMEKYEDTLTNRANFWNYIAVFLGTFISSTFASSLEWDETFKVSLIIVVVAYLVFCSGKCCYDHGDPTGKMVAERMNQAKPLVKLLPLWITFIVYSLVEATGYTLFIEQSENLDDRIDLWIPIYSFNRIPLTSFYVLQTFTTFIISLLCDFLIKKFWSSEESIQHRARYDWNVIVSQSAYHMSMEMVAGSTELITTSPSVPLALGTNSKSLGKSWSNLQSRSVENVVVQRFRSWP